MRRAKVPFTPAHIAAALPVMGSDRARRWLDPLALVIGTVAPDFDYFLHGRMQGSIAHTLPGLFVFDIPVALVLWVFARHVAARPVLASLPTFLAERCGRPRDDGSTRFVRLRRAVLGAAVGSASHLVWDGFTHYYGFAVQAMPWMRETMAVGWFGEMRIYRWFQHGSTIFGFLAVAIALVVWLPRRPPRTSERFPHPALAPIVPTSVVIGAAAGLGVGLAVHGPLDGSNAADLAVAAIDGALVAGVAAIAIMARVLPRSDPSRQRPTPARHPARHAAMVRACRRAKRPSSMTPPSRSSGADCR